MLLNGKVNYVDNAIDGQSKINGMYVVYTKKPDTVLPVISSGWSIQEATTALSNTPNTGVCRVDAVAIDFDANVSSGSVTSGTVIGTTANAHHVAGMAMSAGVYVRGAITAHLTEVPSTDIGFDYTSGGSIVIPANGAVTIIDKVRIQ